MIFQNYALHMGGLSGGLLILLTEFGAEAGVATDCSVVLLNHKLLLTWHCFGRTAGKSTEKSRDSGGPLEGKNRE